MPYFYLYSVHNVQYKSVCDAAKMAKEQGSSVCLSHACWRMRAKVNCNNRSYLH